MIVSKIVNCVYACVCTYSCNRISSNRLVIMSNLGFSNESATYVHTYIRMQGQLFATHDCMLLKIEWSSNFLYCDVA